MIITVAQEGDGGGVDLEVPADIPAYQLALKIAHALGWGMRGLRYRLLASPPGRVLDGRLSLAESGVWDGALLRLQSDTEQEGPLLGWRLLELDSPG